MIEDLMNRTKSINTINQRVCYYGKHLLFEGPVSTNKVKLDGLVLNCLLLLVQRVLTFSQSISLFETCVMIWSWKNELVYNRMGLGLYVIKMYNFKTHT